MGVSSNLERGGGGNQKVGKWESGKGERGGRRKKICAIVLMPCWFCVLVVHLFQHLPFYQDHGESECTVDESNHTVPVH